MTKTIKGISAGFVATAVLSMILVAKGMMAPAMTLMLHVIYGAVLGSVYGKLASNDVISSTKS